MDELDKESQLKLLKKLNRRTRFTQFIAWMALFFTMVGIAAGYKNWLRIHDKAKRGLANIAEIRQELPQFAKKEKVALLEKEINDNLKDNKTHLDKAMRELRQIQDSTQHIAETVYTQVEALTQQQSNAVIQTPSIKDWSLGEVHFLLQTAVQRFNLKQDKAGAIEAFKLADTLLVERASVDLLPVRKQISEDIAAVRQYAAPDKMVVSKQIDHLLAQLKPVKKTVNAENEGKNIDLLSVKEKQDMAENVSTKDNQQVESESLVSRVKKTINNAVIIRKFDKPLQLEKDAEAQERLFQLLSLRLETLRMMLLQGDDTSYHQQIKRIKILLQKYYPDDQKQLQEQLDELNKVNLNPELPDISKSLKLLNDSMARPGNERH